MRVFVLIFNAGTDNEGIHSIRIGNENKILMFESEDDALRFALLLEAQDFPALTVEMVDADEIQEFCQSSGYEWELIPANGELVLPPEINVEESEWLYDADESQGWQDDTNKSIMSENELDTIRRQLEGLL